MKKYKRIFTIVIDSLGVGAMPDAAEYDDVGTDTLGHIDDCMDPFVIPNLARMGLANLHPLKHVKAVDKPLGYFGRLLEASTGKDTILQSRFRRLQRPDFQRNFWMSCQPGQAIRSWVISLPAVRRFWTSWESMRLPQGI